MERLRLRRIGILIALIILLTLGFQIYWNISNYQVLEQRIRNEISNSLDQSVDAYFAGLAKGKINEHHVFKKIKEEDSENSIMEYDSVFIQSDSAIISVERNVKTIKLKNDSSRSVTQINWSSDSSVDQKLTKSILRESLTELTSMVIISLQADSLKISVIDSILKEKLKARELDISWQLKILEERDSGIIPEKAIRSRSSYLSKDQELYMSFEGATDDILKRGIAGISISFFISLIIIFSLIYLYREVKNQKELSEIKDDLISNMTHEFKTPIATINAALDGIIDFNKKGDRDKAIRYAKMSRDELKKLSVLIEKLLDSASMDSTKLSLKKEEVEFGIFVEKIVQKYQIHANGKTFNLKIDEHLKYNFDPFYLEIAISNIIDNAIKYGGNTIDIQASRNKEGMLLLEISDNGGGISPSMAKRVFDKFFRIPSGEVHNVKGQGLGLFMSKEITEAHDGFIRLVAKKDRTTFIIILA